MMMTSKSPHGSGLIILLALLPFFSLAQENGQENCQCVEFHGLTKYLTDDRKSIVVKMGGEKGGSYDYPSTYGNSVCKAWDEELPPFCVKPDGTKKAFQPAWCKAKWCYVNKDDCSLPMKFESS